MIMPSGTAINAEKNTAITVYWRVLEDARRQAGGTKIATMPAMIWSLLFA
jgi:hypothetical protein